LTPVAHLPGLFEALMTSTVGATLNVPVVLPEDYPVEELRGQTLDFTVGVKAASQVRWGSLEDPVVLGRLNKGANIDAVIEAAAGELEEESIFDAMRASEARALEAVLNAAEVDIDPELVEAEMMQVFAGNQGRILEQMGAEQDEQNEALTSFMYNEDERTEVAVRLANNAILNAIAAQYDLTPSLLQVGIEADEKTLAQNNLLEHGRRQAALDFLMDRCVQFPN
jgi:trigger factor